MRINSKKVAGVLASTALAATLAACGGSGSGGTGISAQTLSGVAATGLAIANGQVSLKCAAGDASPVRTLADGSYSADISAVTLPCVVRVDYNDATTSAPQRLHSLAQVAGNVNITPVTDMLLANLSSTGVAADAFDQFDAKEVRTYSAERIRTAAQTVKTELQSRGVDVTHLPDDPIGTELHAANGSSMGDEHDGVLDEIQAKLHEQGKTLHDVETEMKSGHETRGLTTSTGQPGDATAGKAAYEANCQSCHGTRMPDAVNAAKILSAIHENEGGMGFLAGSITSAIADNIATYMANGAGNGTALKTQTITFASPGDQTLGVAAPALSATATSGLAVTITSSTPVVCTVSNNTLTLLAAGTCSLSANQNGDASYNAAVAVVNTFTVASAGGVVLPGQTISFASPGPQQVGTPVALSASADSGLAVSFASTTPTICTMSGNTLTPVAAGNCTVTANQAGDGSYAAAATVTRTFAVTDPAAVASAANGKALYASNGCGGCHGAVPASMNVLAGANNPTVIQNAIASISGMAGYSGLTSQNLADIAAYLATPTI
ncbi:MAG: cytochrome c [Burkholderiales bacterium]|nr:cytochrome c [Burkholderiales bacterium]